MSIATRAIGSLTRTQGIGDLYRIYATTQRDGIDFNLDLHPADVQHAARRGIRHRLHARSFCGREKFGTGWISVAEISARLRTRASRHRAVIDPVRSSVCSTGSSSSAPCLPAHHPPGSAASPRRGIHRPLAHGPLSGREADRYRVAQVRGRMGVEARVDSSMSLMARPVEIDLAEKPIFCWRWYVDGPVQKADMTRP